MKDVVANSMFKVSIYAIFVGVCVYATIAKPTPKTIGCTATVICMFLWSLVQYHAHTQWFLKNHEQK